MALFSIDPWGMPVATQVVSGERADDPLYVPAIKQVRNRLGVSGLLYVGDSKMAAVATRAFVQENKDTYLCPLSKQQLSAATLSEYLAVVPTPLVREDAMGQCKEIAVGFEREVKVTHQTAVSAPSGRALAPIRQSRGRSVTSAFGDGACGTGSVE